MRKTGCTWRHRWAAERESSGWPRTASPNCSWRVRALSAWPSRHPVPCWWRPATPFTAWTLASRGGRLSRMNAEIIAVGSEMLTSQRLDTNSLYLTDELNALGIEVVRKCVIGDDMDRLA